MLLLKQKWHTTSSNKHKHQCKFRANSWTYFLMNIHSHKTFFYLKKMHPCAIKAPLLPRLIYVYFQGVFATYITCTSLAKFTYMHTQSILATKNCTRAHSGISNTYAYTNFVMNLGYLHNKVLHFMLYSSVFAT